MAATWSGRPSFLRITRELAEGVVFAIKPDWAKKVMHCTQCVLAVTVLVLLVPVLLLSAWLFVIAE
jgi:hypothetical protein